jgi:N4-gp56 family major capsid protein
MFFISRLAMDTSVGGTKEALMKELGEDAAGLVNSSIQTAALGGGTVIYGKDKVHRSDVIKACTATVRDIRRAVRLLQLSSVPMFDAQTYAGLLHPDVQFDIQTDSNWTNVNLYQQQAKGIFTGETGQMYNVRFKLAPTIPILVNSGSANVDIYRTLICGREFVAWSELDTLKMIMNEPAKTRELGTANAYGYYFRAVSTVLSNQKAVRLETSATLGTN